MSILRRTHYLFSYGELKRVFGLKDSFGFGSS